LLSQEIEGDSGGEETIFMIKTCSGEDLPSEEEQLAAGRKARLEAIAAGKAAPPVIVRVQALSPEQRAERLRERAEYLAMKQAQSRGASDLDLDGPAIPEAAVAPATAEKPPVEAQPAKELKSSQSKARVESMTAFFARSRFWPSDLVGR